MAKKKTEKQHKNELMKTAERARALALRREGMAVSEIAEELGRPSKEISKYINDALETAVVSNRFNAESLRELEIQRMDMAMKAIQPAVSEGDYQAIDRWIKLSERRAKLLGLDKGGSGGGGGSAKASVTFLVKQAEQPKSIEVSVEEEQPKALEEG